LHKLFEQEEIAPVIKSAMQEYKGDPAEEEFADIQKHGILPFLILRTVVIDEVERKILFRLGTHKDANLEEHGITIYWKRSKWRFGYAEVISDYIQNLDLINVSKQSRVSTRITDPSFLYGRWVFDEESTVALWRAKGEPVDGLSRLRKCSEEYSEGSCRFTHPDGHVYEFKLLNCELKGVRLNLTMQYETEPPATYKLKYDGHRLIREFVLRREGASQD
jgi:hypothetical protein